MREEADGIPDQKQRAAACYDAWRKSHPSSSARVLGTFETLQDDVQVRRETLNGVEHLVVPAVLLREGVFQCANCESPEFYAADEFAKVAAAWNGRPVTLNHPKKGDVFVSAASDPQGWEDWRIGTVFNAARDEDRLKAELWIDLGKLTKGSDAEETAKALENGAQLDVSVAAWHDAVPQRGSYDGKQYYAVQRNYQSDHVAILPAGVQGACSWADGCGTPRVNVGLLAVEDACCSSCAEGGPCVDDEAKARVTEAILAAAEGMSDVDRRTAIQNALTDKLGRGAHVVAVYDGAVVYEGYDDDGGYALKRRSYRTRAGKVTVGDDEERVRPETQFVSATAEDGDMADPKTKAPGADQKTDPPVEDPKTAAQSEPKSEPPKAAEAPKVPTLKELFAAASAEERREAVQSALSDEEREIQEQGRRLYQAERVKKIERIKAHQKNPYSDDELAGMKMADLDKVTAFLPEPEPVDYSARGMPRANQNGDARPAFYPSPPSVFGRKEAE